MEYGGEILHNFYDFLRWNLNIFPSPYFFLEKWRDLGIVNWAGPPSYVRPRLTRRK